jgi:outer membrane protein TolC
MRSFFDPPSRRASFTSLFAVSVVGLSLGLVAVSRAAPAEISLDETRKVAAGTAPIVAAGSARVTAARNDAARADALPDPRLSIGIDNLTVTGVDAWRLGADDMTMRRIGVMQEWPSRRKREARRATAEARVDSAVDEVKLTRLEVERQAGNAWIESWAAEAEVRFLLALIAEADRAVEIAKAQLANATGSAADALAAQLARAELDNELRRAQAQVGAARAGLARWLDSDLPVALASMPDVTRLRVPADILRDRLDQHANLQVWQGRQREAEAAVLLAQAEKRPDLGFAASYGARSAGLPDMMMVEVSVGLPVFTRNRQDRDIAARRAEFDAVEGEREDARRAQREGLERLLASWDGMRDESVRYRDTLLPLARDRSATALAGYSGGGEFQAVLDARRDEVTTGRRALQLQADLARAWLALDTLLPVDSRKEVRP